MFILFDIGGTKMRVSTSSDLDSFVEPTVVQTPTEYEIGREKLFELINNLRDGENIRAIAGGIAGPFSDESGALRGSPNLSDWIHKPFRKDLEDAFGVPVYIENDSALVGLGEAVRGAGSGHEIVAYITVSTGVGGARIVKGKLDERSIGFEPGHQIIDAGGLLCKDCRGKTLGHYISGHAVKKRLCKPPEEIRDEDLWKKLAEFLAYGLNNTIVHWSPDIVVLGGSMIVGDPAIPIAHVEDHLSSFLKIYSEVPQLKKGTLGDYGGLYGGLELIKQKHQEKTN